MTKFENIIKLAQRNQSIQKSLGLSSQLSEMLKSQESDTKSLSGIRMLAEIAKNLQEHNRIFENPALSEIQKMAKGLMLQPTYTIPQATINAIAAINRQHEQLFDKLRGITEAINKNQVEFNQINNWQFAIRGISGQLAAFAASQKKWDLIDNFEEITEEAVSLNESIFDENGVTKEGLNKLKAFFQRIEIKVNKIDPDANTLFWKLLALLSFILSVMGEARNWLPKPEYATKQEVETVIKEQFGIYEGKLKKDKEFRITSRVCKVMSKPRFMSLVIEKLPPDFEVTVLQVNHKWVYVSYFSSVNNLPQTGWVMKKYLKKPE